jgi:hypothetical protein
MNKDSKTKRLYLTKPAGVGLWHYVGDPANPNTTLDAGLIRANYEEIRIDAFGAYVLRSLLPVEDARNE